MPSMIGCSVELPGTLRVGSAEEGFELGDAEETECFGVVQTEHVDGPCRAAVLRAELPAGEAKRERAGARGDRHDPFGCIVKQPHRKIRTPPYHFAPYPKSRDRQITTAYSRRSLRLLNGRISSEELSNNYPLQDIEFLLAADSDRNGCPSNVPQSSFNPRPAPRSGATAFTLMGYAGNICGPVLRNCQRTRDAWRCQSSEDRSTLCASLDYSGCERVRARTRQ